MFTEANRVQPGPDGDAPLTVAVVEAVSAASGTPVEELPPLHDAIDPDALNALFSGHRTSGWVEFRYAGHAVTVHADGTVDVSGGR